MKTTGKVATGFLIGTAVGAALGLLFAPKKGKKTRAMLADQARNAKKKAGNIYDEAREFVDSAREKVLSN